MFYGLLHSKFQVCRFYGLPFSNLMRLHLQNWQNFVNAVIMNIAMISKFSFWDDGKLHEVPLINFVEKMEQ